MYIGLSKDVDLLSYNYKDRNTICGVVVDNILIILLVWNAMINILANDCKKLVLYVTRKALPT